MAFDTEPPRRVRDIRSEMVRVKIQLIRKLLGGVIEFSVWAIDWKTLIPENGS